MHIFLFNLLVRIVYCERYCQISCRTVNGYTEKDKLIFQLYKIIKNQFLIIIKDEGALQNKNFAMPLMN